jgi:hypothetical protein
MGGFGSGRYRWSSRDTVEDWRYRSFGIKEWVDRGLVRPGHAFTQIWLSKDGRPAASIEVHISTVSPVNRHLAVLLSDRSAVPDRLQAVLKYRAGRVREELRDIEEAIWLDERPCGFKGGNGCSLSAPAVAAASPSCTPTGSTFAAESAAGSATGASGRRGRRAGWRRRCGSSGNSGGAASTSRQFRSGPKACTAGPTSGCATKGRKRNSRIKTGS